MKLGVLVGYHIFENSLGEAYNSKTGFILKRNPDTVRAPDFAFVRKSRIPAGGRPVKFFDGPPDLAVEVLSPSDTVEDVEDKIAEYLDAGCLIVWIVKPKQKSLTIHTPHANPIVLRENDTLTDESILPGFSCKVGEFFT